MLLIRINRRILQNIVKTHRCYATTTLANEEEYTESPQYPEIMDLSKDKVKERERQAYYEEVKAVKTVEEKQIKLNMPRYYGFKCFMLYEDKVPYNNLQLAQYLTKTHLVEQDKLPNVYDNINVDNTIADIKQEVEEILVLEYSGYRKNDDNLELNSKDAENLISSSISTHVNRSILNNMNATFPHLLNTQVDIDPRIESFWFAGGITPPTVVKKQRRGLEWLKPKENEPIDRAIQYIGTPNLTLRSEIPLTPIVPYSEAENPSFDFPHFQYDPRVVHITSDHRRAVNTPGFWPGDTYQFGLLSYHRRGHMLDSTFGEMQDDQETLHRQGILASFGWLNAQANFLGFTTYNDITYPLVSQCVITNGQKWSFYVYQLNTMLVHSKNHTENPKRNICWATKELKLFDEIKDEKVVGFNDDVLKTLVKFYANVPQTREGVELRPYLNTEEKVIADYVDDDKRQWLEREYKFITSNRPRLSLPYEVYHWEKIYKIDHKKRPMEARRRPFELFQNPFKRRYDERQARYIPRKLRPDVKKHVGRYAKEYFP